jgi:AcrR family transcriptional regulator
MAGGGSHRALRRAGESARLAGGGGSSCSPTGSRRSHSRVAEIQRSRLLAAAVGVIDERGYAGASIANITDCARVSRRTFYELFANREECLVAVLGDALGWIEGELAAVNRDGLQWRERVRVGLWVILSCLDREPALARACVVQSVHGGPDVLRRREAILARLVGVVDEGRLQSTRAAGCTRLTAEGLVGAALRILYTRLKSRELSPLTSLLGELTGMIVLPYLGPAVAHRERRRAAPELLAGSPWRAGSAVQAGEDPLEGVPMRLTYRTTRVLEWIAEHPGASNRQVSDHTEIADQGQISKLLARLERLGLLANSGAGHVKGEPNVWALTTKGERVAQNIGIHSIHNQRRAA